jgi:hypothetical protein
VVAVFAVAFATAAVAQARAPDPVAPTAAIRPVAAPTLQAATVTTPALTIADSTGGVEAGVTNPLAAYLSPPLVAPLPELDPGLARRGPRPSMKQLATDYQYGVPNVMVSRSAGRDDWRLRRPDHVAVYGYADSVSVLPGAELRIHLAGRDRSADLDVFRMGLGDAHHVLSVSGVRVRPVLQASPNSRTGLVIEHWPLAATIHVGRGWRSGVYLIKLTGNSGGQSYILFVVRPPHPTGLTVVIPTMTYQAYNDYGGADLYDWPGHPQDRGFVVSFDRPMAEQFGGGLFFRLDFPLVTWLEDRGFAPDYIADVDIAHDPTVLSGVRTLVFSGHSEYWTGSIRSAVDAAAAGGDGIAFMGANQAYWQVRLSPGSGGRADRVMTCYKSAALDPIAASHPADATVKFSEAPVLRPSSALIGQPYGGIVAGVTPMTVGPGITAFAPDLGLDPGQRLPGLIGEEVDVQNASFRGVALGATRHAVTEHGGTIVVGPSVWVRPAGGRIFDAGTFDYAWGLDPRYASALPGFPSVAFSDLTARILSWLAPAPDTPRIPFA